MHNPKTILPNQKGKICSAKNSDSGRSHIPNNFCGTETDFCSLVVGRRWFRAKMKLKLKLIDQTKIGCHSFTTQTTTSRRSKGAAPTRPVSRTVHTAQSVPE